MIVPAAEFAAGTKAGFDLELVSLRPYNSKELT